MKILDSIWFTPFGSTGCIGIVIGEDEVTNEIKTYIGNSGGVDMEFDIRQIARNGAKLHIDNVIDFLTRHRKGGLTDNQKHWQKLTKYI